MSICDGYGKENKKEEIECPCFYDFGFECTIDMFKKPYWDMTEEEQEEIKCQWAPMLRAMYNCNRNFHPDVIDMIVSIFKYGCEALKTEVDENGWTWIVKQRRE